ncbi:MAG: helix-turn-helix transcriptional regulator [bacterium]|nr:helix-turn-helix transcriptional regulator [bacterium]
MELHILHHADGGEIYGLWMIEELIEHGYRINASQLYPKFHRLVREGFLKRRERVIDGKQRKYYRATAAGRKRLGSQKAKLMELAGEALSADDIRAVLKNRVARDRRKRKQK